MNFELCTKPGYEARGYSISMSSLSARLSFFTSVLVLSLSSTLSSHALFTPPPSESNSSTAPHYLIFIVVLSTSTKEGRDFRDTIRNTWAQDCHNRTPPILITFSIGTLGLSSSVITDLAAEDEVHDDLLLLENLHDTYSNLTRKVLYSFLWADRNINFSYLLKTDHDSFVFVNDLYNEVYRFYQDGVNKLYWGCFNRKAKVITNSKSKWAERNWFLCDHYLPYAFGGGYIISADLIHKIAITSDYLQLYNSEDVSVSVWLSAYQIQRRADKRFRAARFSNHDCAAHACLLLTSVTLQEMHKLHHSQI